MEMKGIVFSEPMVRAWLAGRKTVTRRIMNPQPYFVESSGRWCWKVPRKGLVAGDTVCDASRRWWEYLPPNCTPYRPGETVYIKETWGNVKEGNRIVYKADFTDGESLAAFKQHGYKWKSPRFMPEWASRGHIIIGDVRPERVQEITEEEAKREGVTLFSFNGQSIATKDYLTAFRWLWDTLHPGSWQENPWVWRIELEAV